MNGRPRTWVWAGLGAGFVAVVVIGVVFAGRFGTAPDLVASPLIGTPAPDVTLPYLEHDGEFRLADTRGDILVVNFWASWCLGCRQEHEALLRAASDYAPFGVQFVGVQYQDDIGRGIGFLDELGRGPETIYVTDQRSRTALEFGVLGLPETFFIDREGTIVGKISGPTTYGLLTASLDAIILGQSPGTVRTGDVENLGDG